jgi:hypothetical protein
MYSGLNKNGVEYAWGNYTEPSAAFTGILNSGGSTGIFLGKGETVSMWVVINRASATNLAAGATVNYFSVHKTSIGTGN